MVAEPSYKRVADHMARSQSSQRCDTIDQLCDAVPPPKVATPTPSRSTSDRWRSKRRRSVPTIRMLRDSGGGAVCIRNKANMQMPSRSTSDRWPSMRICFGPGHPNVAKSMNNLGLLYRAQGRYPDAEPLYKRSLATCIGRPGVRCCGASLNFWRCSYYEFQGPADAKPLYKRSLAIREKAMGPDHPRRRSCAGQSCMAAKGKVATPTPSHSTSNH